MRVLRLGIGGDDVKAFQYFLRGEEFYHRRVDGSFGDNTAAAVKKFQGQHNLVPDGVVGRATYAKALELGFDPLVDTYGGEDGPNWPKVPELRPRSAQERNQDFGHIEFSPAGSSDNPEAVVVTNNWAGKHVVRVEVPQLASIPGIQYKGKLVSRGPQSGYIEVHKAVAEPLQDLWQMWEDAGLLELVKTWDGLGNTRFVRGSRTRLSNHAYYSAFDINYRWNMLGRQPALKGKVGSVRELVECANDTGWFWGGHFARYDGMHFEYAGPIQG